MPGPASAEPGHALLGVLRRCKESGLTVVLASSASLDATSVVLLGDAVWDGQACGKLGLPLVGVECGGTCAAELRENGDVEMWRDPADLLAHEERSAVLPGRYPQV